MFNLWYQFRSSQNPLMDHFLLSHYSQGTPIGFSQKDLHIRTGLQACVLYIFFTNLSEFERIQGSSAYPELFPSRYPFLS